MTLSEEADFMRVRDDIFADDESYRLFQNALINNPVAGTLFPVVAVFVKFAGSIRVAARGNAAVFALFIIMCRNMRNFFCCTPTTKIS